MTGKVTLKWHADFLTFSKYTGLNKYEFKKKVTSVRGILIGIRKASLVYFPKIWKIKGLMTE